MINSLNTTMFSKFNVNKNNYYIDNTNNFI